MSATHKGTSKKRQLFESAIVRRAAVDALKKLNPAMMAKNPVMFVVEVGSVVTTALLVLPHGATHFAFNLQITLWLWFTVLFVVEVGSVVTTALLVLPHGSTHFAFN